MGRLLDRKLETLVRATCAGVGNFKLQFKVVSICLNRTAESYIFFGEYMQVFKFTCNESSFYQAALVLSESYDLHNLHADIQCISIQLSGR